MAITNNILLKDARGCIGNMTVSQRGKKTVLSAKRGPSSKPPSEEQLKVLARFSSCSAYARAACTNPALKEAYQENAEPGRSSYQAAMKDAFNAPTILDVSRHEKMIVVETIDDFKVKSVSVSVYDEADELIEKGEAVMETNELYWTYQLISKKSEVVGVRFVIVAEDYPGNETEATIIM